MKNLVGIPSWLKSIVVTALLIAIMLLLSFMAKFGLTPSEDQGAWGQFGDFVGGILNPLFSIIGLLALLYTIVLQSEELRKSTQELKSSAKALKKQNKHYARQQFDTNFFQLLSLQREQASSAVYGALSNRVTGQAAFVRVMNDYHRWYGIIDDSIPSLEDFIIRFDTWYGDEGHRFDNYLSGLTNLISYVYFSGVSKKARLFAYTTISSNLSSAELAVFFLGVTFNSKFIWVRELLEEDEFFRYCQTDYFDFEEIWSVVFRCVLPEANQPSSQ
ncbi:hypothetical protein T3H00_28410 [Pseudomonas fluorescens]|uniref:hypothetical protein n=1 Tax=Pseudomonas fluorescens TaxID=294 RepID=UPI002ACABD0D|nr:hypothetical protein [Pseudomonas fluorescens]MDZ5436571.1 hypothetical protein [Pseudomonas fluorescens]